MDILIKKPNEKILYIGDNLPIMLGMESGMVDLIYTDPPFNSNTFRKGKTEKHSFNDTWSDKQVDYAHAIALKFQYPDIWNLILMTGRMHSPTMQHYLEFMAPRIVQMYRLLKSTGSLYLHCDPNASHYLKLILDNVFDRKNFRNEIVLHYRRWSNSSSDFLRMHDVLLRYSKGKVSIWNKQYQPYSDDAHVENTVRGMVDGKLVRLKDKKGNYIEREKENKSVPLHDVWHDINFITPTSKERTGYATQKPIALLDRIITASSNEGDLILDPFCGCATACVAAAGLNRRWIGIDQNDEAAQILSDRMGGQYFTADYQTNMPTETKADRQKAIKLPKRKVTGYKKITKKKAKQNLLQVDYKKYNYTFCKGCIRKMDEEDLTVDHILAVDNGGLDELSNFQLLCTRCNSRKGTKDMKFLYEVLDAEIRQKRLEIEGGRENYE